MIMTTTTHIYWWLNKLRPRQDGRHFRQSFQMYFLQWKLLYIHQNFIEICSLGTKSSIRSDNGLVPSRRQAIIRTNDGLVWWCIYASLGLNDLMQNRPTPLLKHWSYVSFALSHRYHMHKDLPCAWLYFSFISLFSVISVEFSIFNLRIWLSATSYQM